MNLDLQPQGEGFTVKGEAPAGTVLATALAYGFHLASKFAHRWLDSRIPLPPHEALVEQVRKLEARVQPLESWARIERS